MAQMQGNQITVGYSNMTPVRRVLWRQSLVDLFAYWESLDIQDQPDSNDSSKQSIEVHCHARLSKE